MPARNGRVRRKVNATGRTRHGSPFVQYFHWFLDSEAYRSLSAVERGVHMMLRRKFNGTNNGNLYLSVRSVADELHCSKDTASRAFKILEERGFIKCPQRGSFHWKVGRASRWVLTEEEYEGELPTKDFMRWKAPMRKSRSLVEDSRSLERDGHDNGDAEEQQSVLDEGHLP